LDFVSLSVHPMGFNEFIVCLAEVIINIWYALIGTIEKTFLIAEFVLFSSNV
jgi:hypothetical protein